MIAQTDMDVFLNVVNRGSFSAAARALGHTPSSVGKRIRTLEQRLGVDLFIRSTRRMTLTDAGRRYADEAREIVARITALEEDLKEGAETLHGTVRLTAPTAYGQRFVGPLVTEFMGQHPGVEVELTLTDKVVDLIGEAVDLAVRTGSQPDSTLLGRRIGPYRRRICAAEGYLDRFGTPTSSSDLIDHRCLKLPGERTSLSWGLADVESRATRLGHGFTCNSLDALARACIEGSGLACLPEFVAGELITSGQLIPVLPNAQTGEPASDIMLLRPDAAIAPRRVRTLGGFLFDRLRASMA